MSLPTTSRLRHVLRQPSFWLLAFSFVAFGFVTAALAVHALPLLESRGVSPTAAVALAALIGPMQVSGRFVDVLFGRRVPALALGAITVLLTPVALAILLVASPTTPAWLYAYVLFYGVGENAGAGSADHLQRTGRARGGAQRWFRVAGVLRRQEQHDCIGALQFGAFQRLAHGRFGVLGVSALAVT